MSPITRALRAACSLLLAAGVAAAGAAAPAASRGVLDLPSIGASSAELHGEWAFAWRAFVDPAAPLDDRFVAVPAPWSRAAGEGPAGSADGFATYRLAVRCPAGEQLAVAMPAQRTAWRLYVNGELAASQGAPGTSAETARPAIGGRANLTQPYACPLQLTVHMSNFSHRAGGMVRAPAVGAHAALLADMREQLVLNTVLLGAYLVLGLVPCIFWLARPKDVTPLLFGAFCLVLALYSDMTGERLLLLLGRAEAGWEAYLRIEYVAWFASMACFLVLVRRLFVRHLHKLPLRLLLAACGACTAAVVLTPASWYSHLAPVGQAVVVGILLATTWAFLRAAREGDSGAQVMLGGMAIAIGVIGFDVLRYNVGGAARSIAPFGLLAFVLAPAIVLARRLARALNAEELRALEQRLRGDLLVRTTKAGIYDWDTTTNHVTYSERLKEILGYPGDADTSKWPVFYEFIHPADREIVRTRFLAQLRACRIASGEMRHEPWEYRLVRADGRPVWILAEAISLTGSDCRTLRYICSFIDVTERREMQEDVERMARHDMKTPLNSIIGVTRLLREDPTLGPDQRELLGIADRAGFRMLEMVNLSLGLYKMETGSYEFRPQAVDLAEVAERVLVDLHGFAEANKVRLQVWGGDAQVYARADELLCYSILANLVKNAVEATPSEGTVTVALDAGPPVCVRVHNPARVPDEVARHFFAKYATAGKSGGTGLGAYSARLMARAQEGELEMTSSDADGTRLTLTLRPLPADALPRSADATVTVRAPLAALPELPAAHVLVVDDDEYNRLILRRYLPSPPLTVETAVNGRAAIDAVVRRWPDVIVIDMEMPVMGGVEAVTWIRKREQQEGRKRCAIIMASSNDDEPSIRRCLASGADRYLAKPVTREALVATLLELATSAQPSGAAQPRIAPIQTLPSRDEEVCVDADLLAEVPAFLVSRQELLAAMHQALAAGDREKLRGLAHRTGGALALYGFRWAAWQSREIELKALAGDAQALQGEMESLERYLREVRFRAAGQ
ncbi:MAG: response regulator [Burkholderiales bacterium]|nr:response regulator [Burkholderiales bacterium]